MAGKFRVELHPRGRGGRFLATTDKEKPLKPKRVKRINVVTQVPKGTSTQTVNRKRKGTTSSESSRAKLALMEELSSEQRKRLRSILAKQATKPQPTAPIVNNAVPQVTKVTKGKTPQRTKASKVDKVEPSPTTAKTKKQSSKVTNDTASKPIGAAADKSLTTESPVKGKVKATRAPKSKVVISAAGVQVEVKHHSSFRVETKGEYKYSVQHEGKELVLNNHKQVMHYDGIPVNGVPDIHKDLSKVKTPELIQTLAAAQLNASKGQAPTWKPADHGSADPSVVGRSKANPDVPNYMGMQIHHVDQWALHPAREIQTKLNKGEITTEQAKQLYLDTIEPLKVKEGTANFQLKLKPKEEREFVILAGGLHQGGTPLYSANHPNFYDPVADKFRPIGIPKEGEGSRDWFDKKFRKQFWQEYAKTQMSKVGKELDHRIKKGDITPAEAKKLFEAAQKSAKDKDIVW